MPLFKEKPFKQKKSKSLHLKGDKDKNNGEYSNRNSYTTISSDSQTSQKGLSRSASHADDEVVLINSIGREDLSATRKVLEAGKVDINFFRNGMSPIHQACITGNINIVKLLLEYGADIDTKAKDGKTPIKLAVLHGHFELAEFLISEGGVDGDIVHGVQ